MAGRPPKDGPRTASGRLSRAKPRSPNSEWQAVTAHAQRVRDAMLKEASTNVDFESTLGRLFAFGQLTDGREPNAKQVNAQRYAAGIMFAGLQKAADAGIGLQARHVRGQNLSASGGRSEPLWEDEDFVRARREQADLRLKAAVNAIGVGSQELFVVTEVVIYDAHPVGYEGFIRLRRGLQALVNHFRMARS